MFASKLRFVTAALLLAAASSTAVIGGASAATEGVAKPVANNEAKMADFLFVENARAMSHANGKLNLKDVNSATLFSDRPDRVAGRMATSEFVSFSSEGKDSFRANPQNANLSIFRPGRLIDVVVVLSNQVRMGKV